METDGLSIKVAVRVRPAERGQGSCKPRKRSSLGGSDIKGNSAVSQALQMQSEAQHNSEHLVCVGSTQVSINSSENSRNFVFDYVANPEASQKEVWENVGLEVTKSTLQGFNGTIIAYGQTGSGKTHTVFGSNISEIASMASPSATGTISISAIAQKDKDKDQDKHMQKDMRNTNTNANANSNINPDDKENAHNSANRDHVHFHDHDHTSNSSFEVQSSPSSSLEEEEERGLVPRALEFIWTHIYSEEARTLGISNSSSPGGFSSSSRQRQRQQLALSNIISPTSSSSSSAAAGVGISSASQVSYNVDKDVDKDKDKDKDKESEEACLFCVTVSMCEIYNERVYDLLGPSAEGGDTPAYLSGPDGCGRPLQVSIRV